MQNIDFDDIMKLLRYILLSKEDKEKIAYVDFEPDGDINTIWIEVAHSAIKNKLLLLINSLI